MLLRADTAKRFHSLCACWVSTYQQSEVFDRFGFLARLPTYTLTKSHTVRMLIFVSNNFLPQDLDICHLYGIVWLIYVNLFFLFSFILSRAFSGAFQRQHPEEKALWSLRRKSPERWGLSQQPPSPLRSPTPQTRAIISLSVAMLHLSLAPGSRLQKKTFYSVQLVDSFLGKEMTKRYKK